MDLPDECWELIVTSLDNERYLEFLSVVSSRFLSITDRIRRSLKVTDPSIPYLPRLFTRFKNLKKIDFCAFQGDLDSILFSISRSGLDLESVNISERKSFPLMGVKALGSNMKNLKELNCSRALFLLDEHLVAIAESCSSLEALDISYPKYDCNLLQNGKLDLESCSGFVTDAGIVALSLKLKRLQRFDLSGNLFITDKCLVSISSNLVLLREISIRDCDFITQDGISLVMRGSPELISVSVNRIGIPAIDSCFKKSFASARALCEVDLSHSFLSDELLHLLAEACLPLKKLTLSHCYSYTSAGISFLLSKYRSLESLDLEAANFLNDESMIELSKFLCGLNYINIGFCSKLTNSTFFTLVRDCPLLSEIKMKATNLGLEDFTVDSAVNRRVKSLLLARNANMSDEFLKKVALLCPSLQMLNVSRCMRITEEGIGEILKSCREVKHLEINLCRQVSNLGVDFELPKLEILGAVGSGIDEGGLVKIGRTCCGLLHLDVKNCLNVTTSGVKEVVENCRNLREINLRCCNLNVDIVAWMVFSRPSLRKITPPSGFAPSENQRKFYLRHGCLVCEG